MVIKQVSTTKYITDGNYECKKCGNKVPYDDTPYFSDEWKALTNKFYELACVKCGDRTIINET